MSKLRIAVLSILLATPGVAALAQAPDPVVHDGHFHLTNYIQEGTDIRDFLKIMGTKVGRAAIFGIPLQQTWAYGNSGDFAPTYYLQSDAPLYYYSFTDAHIAMAYRSLTKEEQARFDPMITGFNPADMYAVDHIKRVLRTFPGVFSGIGEFTIHKEFVSAKVAGEIASLTNPALDRILDFAAEAGLVVILHNDVNMPFPKPGQDPYPVVQLSQLLKRHPKTTVIWAHCGLGRIVRPVEDQVGMVRRALANPELDHVSFDISWDETAKYLMATPETIQATADLINRYPDRFLFGTDEVAPTEQAKYLKVYDLYAPLLREADAGGEREAAQGQLRAAVRRGPGEGPGVGEGEPEMSKEAIVRRTIVASLLLAAAPVAWAADGAAGPEPDADAHAGGHGGAGAPPRPRRSPGWTSTASPCWTWATSPARTTRTGSTSCGRPSCRRTRTSTARTAASSRACARAASA